MAIEKTSSQITPDIESRLEALAEFISEESLKSDGAVNGSNWLIFERYNSSKPKSFSLKSDR